MWMESSAVFSINAEPKGLRSPLRAPSMHKSEANYAAQAGALAPVLRTNPALNTGRVVAVRQLGAP